MRFVLGIAVAIWSVGCSRYLEQAVSSDDGISRIAGEDASCTPESCFMRLEVTGEVTSLEPLSGLYTYTHLLIDNTTSLNSLAGVEDVVDITQVSLDGNAQLSDVSALSGMRSVEDSLDIKRNPSLEEATFEDLRSVGFLSLDAAALCIFNAPRLDSLGGCSVDDPGACGERECQSLTE